MSYPILAVPVLGIWAINNSLTLNNVIYNAGVGVGKQKRFDEQQYSDFIQLFYL